MLDPEYLLRISEGGEDIAETLHNDIIQKIIDRIALRLDRGDSYILTAQDKWQLEVLQDAGYLLEDIQAILSQRTGLMQTEIAEAMEDAGVRAISYDNRVYEAAGLSPLPLEQSPYLIRLMQRTYEATIGEWRNFTRTTADAAQRAFIKACDKAYTQVASGSTSYSQAFAEAINDIISDGVMVTYPSGHTDTIETATLRCIRTGVSQATAEITDARMEEMDWDIILVSSHLGARVTERNDYTNHFWWQGKFYSKSGKDSRFPPFSVCGQGNVQGIHGANCRHSHGPGDGEFNPYDQYDAEENQKEYELQQRQRVMERRIRDSKRKCIGLKEAVEKAGTPEGKAKVEAEYQKQAALLQKRNKAYNDFCEQNDLKKLNERISIAKWDRSQAAKARAAARKYKQSPMATNAESRNDWTNALPRFVTKQQKKEIIQYASDKGITIPGLKFFDGDTELLKSCIDALTKTKQNIPVKKPVVLSIGNIADDEEFGSTVDYHITINAKALRDRKVTEENIAKGGLFASKKVEDIVIHEYGHIINTDIGNKGIDFTRKAYYNTYKEELSIDDLPDFLIENVSPYSAKIIKGRYFREIVPEVLAKNSSEPNVFTEEFMKLLERLMSQ